ncbi:MAG: 23S rRNA (guanosine(2251)-2'-O)-methyltransferase RlmB [Endozoicomonadaceae bacterium]|nr:23S rRNA (guanosine(2251)-2'-O)-methyltransferase RlmB [Endozoicomonadaceae bacterium]MCY4330823.1 23S rRNA (guanosine(2251)-2'-O)-methyltransferase RlmB [Endozoicomonadaceae bacterium]
MEKADLVYGIHPVQAVLENHPEQIKEIWIQKGIHNNQIRRSVKMAESKGVVLHFTDHINMNRKAGGVHQGILAIIQATKVYHEKDLYTLLDRLKPPFFLLLLDSITDPHNLGACLRSADAAGIHAVIAPKDRSAPLNATAKKVACGATEHLPFITVTNLVRTMEALKEYGIWLTGTADAAKQTLYETPLTGNIAFVMGAEGKGLRRLTKEHCDTLVSIPMNNTMSSLNVSVATGVCLFEAVRQRLSSSE